MKKLFFIFALLVFSYSSMAMGFPHNTNTHHRLQTKAHNKILVVEKVSTIAKNKISDKASTEASFVELVINYVFKLFCREVSKSNNSLAIRQASQSSNGIIAIKQELDFSVRS